MKKVRAVVRRRPDEKLVALEDVFARGAAGRDCGCQIEDSRLIENVVAVGVLFVDPRRVIEIEGAFLAKLMQRCDFARRDLAAFHDERRRIPCPQERETALR